MPRLLTEEDIRDMESLSQIVLEPGAIITPAARDLLEEKGIRLLYREKKLEPSPQYDENEIEMVVEAVIEKLGPDASRDAIIDGVIDVLESLNHANDGRPE